MEEWKKVASQLDKDHAKEYKKARADIKKKSSDTIKLQKKMKKEEAFRCSIRSHPNTFSLFTIFLRTLLIAPV
ncbi:Metastasis suppressor protein 1 [Liparis tanakae]|uniref:Metastasis suppressor protein 1 n=1 Tax=Liparis tanakae TaxID=230148 RepID=A0A4Z2FDG2_9TELE|nr:Metastasis suppressor protein 1 [Liparis tanakae]